MEVDGQEGRQDFSGPHRPAAGSLSGYHQEGLTCRGAETVPVFNTRPQLCFQKHQLGHKHCSETRGTAAKPLI